MGMSRCGAGVAALLIVTSFLLSCADSGPGSAERHRSRAELEWRTVNREALREAIGRGGDYLTRACGQSGRFAYRINLNPEIIPTEKYNLLRHAGTVYSLIMLEGLVPRESTRLATDRAIGYLSREAVGRVAGRDDLLLVWSWPEITGSAAAVQAKLGGAGLGLAAMAGAERISPGTTPLETLRGNGEHALDYCGVLGVAKCGIP